MSSFIRGPLGTATQSLTCDHGVSPAQSSNVCSDPLALLLDENELEEFEELPDGGTAARARFGLEPFARATPRLATGAFGATRPASSLSYSTTSNSF